MDHVSMADDMCLCSPPTGVAETTTQFVMAMAILGQPLLGPYQLPWVNNSLILKADI